MKAFEYGPVFCSCSKSRKKNKDMSNHRINLLKVGVRYDIWHYNKLNIAHQQNPYRMAWIGLDCRLDRTLDQIKLDWYFCFWCRRRKGEKLFLIMTQMALNKKSEFSQQESNLWLVKTRLGLNYILVGCPCLTQVALRGGYGISCIHRPFHLCL